MKLSNHHQSHNQEKQRRVAEHFHLHALTLYCQKLRFNCQKLKFNCILFHILCFLLSGLNITFCQITETMMSSLLQFTLLLVCIYFPIYLVIIHHFT